jgi:putative FmdB family regulatory protein
VILYQYECQRCGAEHEATRACAQRYEVTCPKCGAPGHEQLILLNARGLAKQFTTKPHLTTEAAVIAEKGAEWRQTPASWRRRRGEPDRLYSDLGSRR